jgi:hypothetical protein
LPRPDRPQGDPDPTNTTSIDGTAGGAMKPRRPGRLLASPSMRAVKGPAGVLRSISSLVVVLVPASGWLLSSSGRGRLPTTFYPFRAWPGEPDAACVVRGSGAELRSTAIYRSGAAKPTRGRHGCSTRRWRPSAGSRPVSPRASPRSRRAYTAVLNCAPSGITPALQKRQSAINSLRARATMPTRRWRLLPRAKRRRCHCDSALRG